MPQFNPDLPDAKNPERDKGYTGYSEGYHSQRAQEAPPSKVADNSAYYKAKSKTAGMEGIGDIIKGVVGTADMLTQHIIDTDLRAQKEGVDNEFGVGAASTTQASGTETPQSPPGLDNAYSQMEGVTEGYQSGRLKESHYWARLDSISRQARARFPGYVDEIDKRMAALSGRLPANALRESLQQEASAKDKVKEERDKLIERAAFDGALGAVFPHDSWKDKSNEEIISGVSAWKGMVAVQDADKARIEHDLAGGRLDQEDAITTAKKHSQQLLTSIFTASNNAAYGSTGNLVTQLKAVQDMASKPGGIVPAEDQNKLLASLNQAETTMNLSLQNWLDQDFPGKKGVSWRSILKEEGVKEVEAPFKARIELYKTAIINKDYGWINHNAQFMEAQKTAAGAKLLSENVDMQLLAGLRANGGDTAVQLFLSQEGGSGMLSSLNATINRELAMKTANGDVGSLNEEFTKWADQGVSDPAAYNAAIKNHVAKLTNDKLTPEMRKNFVNVMYGDENLKMIAKWPEARQLEAYRNMTSPEVQKTMEGIKASDPESWGKYQKWVTTQFQGLFRKDIMDAREAVTTAPYLTISWDPAKGKFNYNELPMPKEMSAARQSYNKSWLDSTKRTLDKINTELEPVAKIMASDQKDPGVYLGDVISKMGLDPHLVKTGSLTDQLLSAIYKETGGGEGMFTKEPDTKVGGVPSEVPGALPDLSGLDEAAATKVHELVANLKAKAAASAADRAKKKAAGEINQ